jgi:hypothetical protein
MFKEVKTKLENTTFEGYYDEKNELQYYTIRPCEGYKLHAKELDETVFDENGNETSEIKKGYTTAFTTVGINYNFAENPREIYAVKE